MKSRTIYQGSHYLAHAMRDGSLIVESRHKRGGRCLRGPQAAVWIEAIETTLDASEAHDLCVAVLQG